MMAAKGFWLTFRRNRNCNLPTMSQKYPRKIPRTTQTRKGWISYRIAMFNVESYLKHKTAILALLVLFGTLIPVNTIHACTCGGEISPAQDFASASSVFSGRVIGIFGNILLVDKVWKGPTDRVRHLHLVTSCSRLVGGRHQEYLVYAYLYDGKLTTTPCGRTRPLSEARLDLHFLGKPVATLEPPPPLQTWPLDLYLAGLLVFSSVVMFYPRSTFLSKRIVDLSLIIALISFVSLGHSLPVGPLNTYQASITPNFAYKLVYWVGLSGLGWAVLIGVTWHKSHWLVKGVYILFCAYWLLILLLSILI